MNKLYFYTLHEFEIKDTNNKFELNKNCFFQLDYCDSIQIVDKFSNQSLSLKYHQLDSLKSLNCKPFEDNLFIELFPIEINPIEKHITTNCEIIIFENSVKIIYKNVYYSYYYNLKDQNYIIENNDILYIFNSINCLCFDLKNKSFDLKKCKKISKNNKNIEILCNLNQNIDYFVLYNFNLSTNNVYIKKYKATNKIQLDNYSLIFTFFNLLKNDFEESKKFLSKEIDYYQIKNYIKQYDRIIELNNTFYLSNHNEIEKIDFKIQNNVIVDID